MAERVRRRIAAFAQPQEVTSCDGAIRSPNVPSPCHRQPSELQGEREQGGHAVRMKSCGIATPPRWPSTSVRWTSTMERLYLALLIDTRTAERESDGRRDDRPVVAHQQEEEIGSPDMLERADRPVSTVRGLTPGHALEEHQYWTVNFETPSSSAIRFCTDQALDRARVTLCHCAVHDAYGVPGTRWINIGHDDGRDPDREGRHAVLGRDSAFDETGVSHRPPRGRHVDDACVPFGRNWCACATGPHRPGRAGPFRTPSRSHFGETALTEASRHVRAGAGTHRSSSPGLPPRGE